MSISKKLKDLIVAFGCAQSAAAIPGTRIDTLIGTLAQHLSSKGSPALSTVHFPVTITEGAGGAVTATTTASFADIKAAVQAGKTVIADATFGSLTMFMPLSVKTPVETPTSLTFSLIVDFESGQTPSPECKQLTFTSSGITASSSDLTVST